MIIGVDASRAFSSAWGGPEVYSYYLIRALLATKSDHRFRLYIGPRAKQSPRFPKFFADLSVINYQLSIIPWPRFWTQLGLAWECLKSPPDVLFVPAHTLPLMRRPSLPTVVTIHDLGAEYLPHYHQFPQKYYLNLATEYAIKHATKIITVSRYTGDDIIKKFKVSAKGGSASGGESSTINVIYEGYNGRVFYPRSRSEIDAAKRKHGIAGDYFLFVGTIQPRKNLARLIEAFASLMLKPEYRNSKEIQNSDLSLVLAGAPGWLNQEIYQAPKKFGVENRVKFVGRLEDQDLAALCSGAAAFVFPSLFEGFGLAPLEAMAAGTPIILSQNTSLPEVGGQAALYLNPESVVEIAQAMLSVLNFEPSEREAKIKAGINQAAEFSWEKAAAETLKVLEEARKKISSYPN